MQTVCTTSSLARCEPYTTDVKNIPKSEGLKSVASALLGWTVLSTLLVADGSRIRENQSSFGQKSDGAATALYELRLTEMVDQLEGRRTDTTNPPLPRLDSQRAFIGLSEGVSLYALSACAFSGCVGSACTDSTCTASLCTVSVCHTSGCFGSLCTGSLCLDSLCGQSGCVGSFCKNCDPNNSAAASSRIRLAGFDTAIDGGMARASWIALGPVKSFRLYQRTGDDWALVRQGPSAQGRLIEASDMLPPRVSRNGKPEYALFLNDV